jgi:hypothetical protein
MDDAPADASILYVDGHVRVYHGDQTKLPRHYVARERLCLRATTDYWVNAMDGQPFFLINKAVDPGLLTVLENDIVPRLLADVPNQPSQEQLDQDPLLHRFTIVFDREGYSPDFVARMKERRIACLMYHKFPDDNWPDDEFQVRPIKLNSGEVINMSLAERGTFLAKKVWVREIRKKAEGGKQTAVLSTDYRAEATFIAPAMFARWSQENFFRYMRQHYGLDRLVDYGTEEIDETTRVVNPAYRKLDGEVRKKAAIISRKSATFGSLSLNGEITADNVDQYASKKSALQEEIAALKAELDLLKQTRKATERHISVAQLPKEERFERLRTASKHFIDTIKMVAYRAETAMASLVREQMTRHDDARTILRAIYNTDADLLPNEAEGKLTVRLHALANQCSEETAHHLCTELTQTETNFPGTNLRLVFELASRQIPRDQEV